MKIFLGADHRGFQYKEKLKNYLKRNGFEFVDRGNFECEEGDDYPDFAAAVAEEVAKNPKEYRGIVVCGSGVGVSVVADKFAGVRACLPLSVDHVIAARRDDDVNVLAIAADFMSYPVAQEIVRAWLAAPFSGDPRHLRRLAKINAIETSAHQLELETARKIHELDLVRGALLKTAQDGLQGPLAMVKKYVQDLLAFNKLTPEYRGLIREIDHSLDAMQAQIYALMNNAQLRGGGESLHKIPTNFFAFAQNLRQEFLSQTEKNEVQLVLDFDDEAKQAMVPIDPIAFRNALGGIIYDAIQKTEREGIIYFIGCVVLRDGEKILRLIIEDGRGEARAARDVKIDFSRDCATADDAGVMYARTVIEQHGGAIGKELLKGSIRHATVIDLPF